MAPRTDNSCPLVPILSAQHRGPHQGPRYWQSRCSDFLLHREFAHGLPRRQGVPSTSPFRLQGKKLGLHRCSHVRSPRAGLQIPIHRLGPSRAPLHQRRESTKCPEKSRQLHPRHGCDQTSARQLDLPTGETLGMPVCSSCNPLLRGRSLQVRVRLQDEMACTHLVRGRTQ
ncbi:unannotated protein [freshwater metagenome]|uniref:Unannotated protein n=1 Tax=freshwater metagenome TaxID=449393 RepID=A0A6J7HMQ0_9ZZZZ